MTNKTSTRGRPRVANPVSGAERARQYRQRERVRDHDQLQLIIKILIRNEKETK